MKGGENMKAKPDYEPKDAAKDKKLGIKENSRKDEKQDAKGMKKKTAVKRKSITKNKDVIDKGMTPKSEAKDAAMDKKRGIRENSKRDVNFDSRGMQNLKSAMMGSKRND